MGAMTFFTKAKGKTPNDAFAAARDEALWEYGHGGYTGTIAEKHVFVFIPTPTGLDPMVHAETLIENDDPRISNKWGPAGCLDLGNNEYLFFGWASS